ncbi:hypothetical protein B0H14DRAFT_3455790 [Mycena olivaceomarginata]|nr:hypothetical protein B0H14DRAFT_3455790 [Mycena olivaceomarginata]
MLFAFGRSDEKDELMVRAAPREKYIRTLTASGICASSAASSSMGTSGGHAVTVEEKKALMQIGWVPASATEHWSARWECAGFSARV